MTTLSIHSERPHATAFHFDIYGVASACAFILAIAVCLRHGDFSAIPALLCLMAMALVVFGITPPKTGVSTGDRGHRTSRATYHHTHLLRRHCLER